MGVQVKQVIEIQEFIEFIGLLFLYPNQNFSFFGDKWE
jgi:hypothetical protein